jgi:hypothetical protein
MVQIKFSDELNNAEENNSVSTIQSILSGIGSGLIQIPKVHFH